MGEDDRTARHRTREGGEEEGRMAKHRDIWWVHAGKQVSRQEQLNEPNRDPYAAALPAASWTVRLSRGQL
jgi:hypothetical protein